MAFKVGRVIQTIGWILGIVGIVSGFIAQIGQGYIIGGSVFGGTLLYGVGELVILADIIADNTKSTADSLLDDGD